MLSRGVRAKLVSDLLAIVPQAVPIEHAMRAGILTIEHLAGFLAGTAVAGSPLAKAVETNDRLEEVKRLVPVASGSSSERSIGTT